jgi:hypothetical protein
MKHMLLSCCLPALLLHQRLQDAAPADWGAAGICPSSCRPADLSAMVLLVATLLLLASSAAGEVRRGRFQEAQEWCDTSRSSVAVAAAAVHQNSSSSHQTEVKLHTCRANNLEHIMRVLG